MTIAVLIHEEEDKLEEINLDIDPVKNEIYKILSGRATFIGQWPDIDVVILIKLFNFNNFIYFIKNLGS